MKVRGTINLPDVPTGQVYTDAGVFSSTLIVDTSTTNQWDAHPNDLMLVTTGRVQMGDPQDFGNKTYVEVWDAEGTSPRIRLNSIGQVYIGDTELVSNHIQFIVDDVNQSYSFDTNDSVTQASINFPTAGAGVVIGGTDSDLFSFWGAPSVTQPDNIGTIIDGTSGTPGTTVTVPAGGDTIDHSALLDGLATIIDRINKIEQVLSTTGLTS